MSNINKREIHNQQLKAFITGFLSDPAHDNQSSRSMTAEVFRIALASLEAEAVGEVVLGEYDDCGCHPDARVACIAADGQADWENFKDGTRLYTAPPAPVSVPESAPVAYIFKHPAGRLFWSLTDESNKGQSDVMPVYSAPVPAFVPPAIEPDYEVIKGILPTANPDEYACCIAADMWNACRAAMLQGADGNSPVIPDGWVACSERMPEDEQEVLTRNKMGHCFVSFFDEHSGLFFDRIDVAAACCIEHILVTHWMPLPAAPQQEVK